MRRTLLLSFVLLFSMGLSIAQEKRIEVSDIWKNYTFYARGVQEMRSMNDGQHFTILQGNNVIKYKYETGDSIDVIISNDELQDRDGKPIRIQEYTFSKDESMVLIGTNFSQIYRHSMKGTYYIYDTKSMELSELSNSQGDQRLAEFSPDGTKVAFVRNNNVFVKDLISGKERAITQDGEEDKIINGTCDWVYEEEFGFTKGFYWSAEGNYIAYYKFDESAVKEYWLTYYGKLYPFQYDYKYPKAGEDNSLVDIHIYNITNGNTVKVDAGEETDQYIPRIKWTNKDGELAVLRLNRLQNHLEILLTNADNGTNHVIYEEKSKYYVDITDNLFFLDGQFVISSEKDGFNHIYLVDWVNKEEKQLTKGNYDIVEIKGVDAEDERVYYTAAKSAPINREVYSINLKGKKEKMLSTRTGHNDADFSKSFDYYILHWSDANNPDQYTLMNENAEVVKVLQDNKNVAAMAAEFGMPKVEFGSFTSEDNVELNYWIIKPNDFDPNKKYPVLFYVYGGPGSQTVENTWSYQNIWHSLLVQRGYIVISVDNRGTGNRGEEFKKCTYLELGNKETQDQIAAAKYFGAKSWVDESRIGIWGWSYGGYMTTLCMTKGADYFKTGIAVAPVSNWRYYDNIYTERFMRTPQENGENYDVNSPISHVEKLKGNYFLIHGTTDDNVHVQNAYDLINALVKADKQFDLFVYPNRNHGIYGGNTRYHLYNMMTDYILENL